MRFHRFWFVAFGSASVLVAAACKERSAPSCALHGFAGGTNGLLPEVYHGTKEKIDELLETPEAEVSPQRYGQLSELAVTLALAHGGPHFVDQGDRLMGDIIGCALRFDQVFPVSPSICGEGLMTPDADVSPPWEPVLTSWPGDIPKDDPERLARMADIQTCLITRLNLYAEKVPIFLTGPHVTPRGDPKTEGFPHEEAVWLATIDPGSHRTRLLHVWPFKSLAQKLQSFADRFADVAPADAIARGDRESVDRMVKGYFHKRICGTVSAELCGLRHHDPPGSTDECKKTSDVDGGIWKCRDPDIPCQGDACNYRPAIATHLSDEALNNLLRAK